MKLQWQIFIAFFRIGIFGFGGGPSMIPLFHLEAVKRYQWMNDQDFSDVLAIGNTLPGPIATKMAGYIGYRVGGVSGAINAVLANIVPSIIAMILMLTLLSAYKDQAWVAGMGQGVLPVVVVMMGKLTWDFFDKSRTSLGWIGTCLIASISVIAIAVLNLHPALLIVCLLVIALLRSEKPKSEDIGPNQTTLKSIAADTINTEKKS
ncbi:MAG: chromate transporter [Oceanospirillaceae bacterium]|nr:chromate transporter [Oceanospirillaceae bacterium]